MAKDDLQPETLGGPNYPMANSSLDSLSLTNPDNVLAGQLRGTQNVGSNGVQIDSANNRIIITNPNDQSKVGFGTVPGSTTGEFGFYALDANGNIIFKIVTNTFYVYDIANSKNVMQIGKLPDASYGFAVAVTGSNVSDIFA